jgi:surface protein
MATNPPKNPATEEQYDLQRGLEMIRRDAIKKGIKAPVANLTDPGFREVMFGPLSRSKRLTRTDQDIRPAVDLWFTNHDAAEKQYGHISDWDVSSVTNMSELFAGKTTFNDDISRWDVSNVTDMKGMFSNASEFNQPIEKWDVSKVTDMSYMFYNAIGFNQNLRMWKVTNVTKSNSIFLDCNISYENKPAKFGGSGGAKKSQRSSKKRSRKGRRTLKRGVRKTRRR